MTRYMIIESIHAGCLEQVYARFHERGRMLPDGLHYLDSWLTRDGTRVYQLMQTERYELFAEWLPHWDDLIDFEIIELGAKPGEPA